MYVYVYVYVYVCVCVHVAHGASNICIASVNGVSDKERKQKNKGN